MIVIKHVNYPVIYCMPLVWERTSPPFGGDWGGFFYLHLSTCKPDGYNGICRTCYSSILKNDGFLKDSTYLCKQRKKEVLPSII